MMDIGKSNRLRCSMSSRSKGTSPPTTCSGRWTGLSTFEQVRRDLAPFYSSIVRPSIDPELMIRILLIGTASAFYISLIHWRCRG
jgi:hypothetical protein